MFEEGQPLALPYHATKFESERFAREVSTIPWRVYRPSIVVGHSQTGEMDKIDGPYYFFRALELASHLPEPIPLLGPRLGETNVVPVDFVAAAIDHIAHQPGLDGRAFHLVDPEPMRSVDLLNAFARAAGAPRITEVLPKAVLDVITRIPGVRGTALPTLGIPGEVVDYVGFTARFDARGAQEALAGTGIEVPPIDDYADTLWEYWQTTN
jgi:thioester reductase-like protein